MPRSERRTAGVTLLELLLVVALLAVLALGVGVALRPRPAFEHARALAHALGMERWRAVQQGRPVVIRTSATGDAVVTARGGFSCAVQDGAPVLLAQRPDVAVHWPGSALAFTADGRARRCDGGGAGNATIGLVDRRGNRAAVIVAALGRVRWEPR